MNRSFRNYRSLSGQPPAQYPYSAALGHRFPCGRAAHIESVSGTDSSVLGSIPGVEQSGKDAHRKPSPFKMAKLIPPVLETRRLTGIEEELKKANYDKDVKVIIYPHGSHLNGLMPNREREKKLYRMIPFIGLMYRTFGKFRKVNLSYFEKSEKEIIEWIN